jgi:VWFA-related protein
MQENGNMSGRNNFLLNWKKLMLCIAVLLSVPAAQAQQQPPQPNIKVDTQLVLETVVVKDKDGKNIERLADKDFTVTEDGVPQAISVFQFQRLEDTPAITPVTATVARSVNTVRPPGPARITPPPPGDARYRNRRLLVLFFDRTGMPPPDQLRAFGSAEKFIRTQMKSPDLLAIMTFDSRGAVKVLRDFTNERDQLLDALQNLMYPDDNDNEIADKGAAFGQDNSEFNIFNTDRKLAALQTAINMLKPVDGQKSLVYFASGLQFSGTSNQAQLNATVNAAIRANVAFFPVDARGLVASPLLGDASQSSPGGVGMYSGATAMTSATRFQGSQDTLFALAGDTGGKAMLDNNDLAAGIVQAEQAITTYYIIGYYPSNFALDGKFRRVQIALKDTPSAKLDFRQGYFAGKTFNKFTASDKERQLEDALMLGDPITDLTIAMEVNYFQMNRTEYFVPITVKLPGSELVQAQSGGAERTLIDFIGVVKNDEGRTVQTLRDKVAMTLRGEAANALSAKSIQYDTAFTLPPGRYVIKFLARDAGTRRIGTYQTPFVIPDLTKEEKRIPISSVVLSSQRVDMRKALYTAAKGKNSARAAQASNPLVGAGQKLIPSVTRVFSESREMYVYLQAYEPNGTSAHPLVAFVSFYRGQTRAFETSPLQFADRSNPKSTALPISFSLSLAKLPPGEYNCQVTVLDPIGEKVAFWQAPIILIPSIEF